MTTVTSYDLIPDYKLLRPVENSPRPYSLITHQMTIAQARRLAHQFKVSDYVALDIETTGLDPYTDEIVGLGLSGSRHTTYIDFTVQDPEAMRHLMRGLSTLPLIAHNIMFDGYWLMVKYGHDFNWKFDTFGLFKHLASEGFFNQSWGLKEAQVHLLGWDDKGDVELDKWLVDNGYTMKNNKLKADKSRMSQAPAEILGKYCAMDADSTYQLFKDVFIDLLIEYEGYHRYHAEEYITLIQLLLKQRERGMLLDVEYTRKYQAKLTEEIAQREAAFRAHPQVQAALADFKMRNMIKKKWKEDPPAMYTAKGDWSKNYLRYLDNLSKEYNNYQFNLESSPQMSELFYGGYIVKSCEKRVDDRGRITYWVDNRVELDATASGKPPIDSAALKWLGEPGRLLAAYKDVSKLRTFVDKYLELLHPGDLLRPGWKTPGTLTGRLSGSEPNLQQLPKSKELLDCFVARPGYVLIGADFASLENVVLAELSRDENLLKLYGPTAKANDGYLYFGSMLPVIGPKIRAAGYDPDNPTSEGIAAAKRQAKAERSIAKVLVLSDQYGAGAEKKFKTLMAQGVDVTLGDVTAMHRTQQQLLAGLAKYRRSLETQWNRNRGWIMNGFNRPLAVSDKLLKDLVNRDGQSTGHDCTMRWIYHIFKGVVQRKLDAHPYIVDFHDESIWEVLGEHAEQFKSVMQEACDELNAELSAAGWICRLKIDIAEGTKLSDVKLD